MTSCTHTCPARRVSPNASNSKRSVFGMKNVKKHDEQPFHFFLTGVLIDILCEKMTLVSCGAAASPQNPAGHRPGETGHHKPLVVSKPCGMNGQAATNWSMVLQWSWMWPEVGMALESFLLASLMLDQSRELLHPNQLTCLTNITWLGL